MTSLSVGIVIAAPRQRVFDLFTDLRNAADHVRDIVKSEVVTAGPIGVGTQWRETRVMFKRECTETLEITAMDSPNSYTVFCDSCGSTFETTFQFSDRDGGTQVEMTFACQARSFFARLMSPLSKLMLKSCIKAFQRDLEDLRAICEGRSPGPDGEPTALGATA